MAFAITQTCCKDASCVSVCPVNCIHPTPQEREFTSSEMLHIDPRTCIDCGACADACPVDAIFPVDSLRPQMRDYARINADYYAGTAPAPVEGAPELGPNFHTWDQPRFDRSIPADFPALRVAVVGTGPAGMYACEDLLLHTSARVSLVDRLPVPGGLVRYGVAPDHTDTRKVGETFARLHEHPRVRRHWGLEIGRDLEHADLAAHHDAVVYAVGASVDRRLGLPGEDLPGSTSATEVVGWYNGHPDVAPDTVDLARVSPGRAVVVGTGNVALDVARILLTDPADLTGTPIAEHALAALRRSTVTEVVLLGRRGPEDAAYTSPELLALRQLPGVDLVVDDHDPAIGRAVDDAVTPKAALLHGVPREQVDWDAPSSAPPADPARRRIVLRFHSSSTEVLGTDRVQGIRTTTPDGSTTDVPTGLVLRAVGHRGAPIPGLPFDEATGTVPNEAGRVPDRPGTYVVGWIKRGSSGGIGANRTCAKETVGSLLEDATAGALPTPTGSSRAFGRLARRRRRKV